MFLLQEALTAKQLKTLAKTDFDEVEEEEEVQAGEEEEPEEEDETIEYVVPPPTAVDPAAQVATFYVSTHNYCCTPAVRLLDDLELPLILIFLLFNGCSTRAG